MENENVEKLENEFYSEVHDKDVKLQDLKNLGVTETFLKEEALLRNIYGDKILLGDENSGNVDLTKKTVTKIDLNEIEKMDEVKMFIEKLSNDEVNTNIEYVLAKIKKEEE